MTTTARTAGVRIAAPDRVPMNPLRKTALTAGVVYLITFISIPTLSLYGPVRNDPNYILGPGPDTPILIGALLELIVALACIGTAVVLFPVVKRQNEGVALGFVGARVLEAATIFAGVASLLTVVSLRQSGAGADALATGQALVAFNNWTFLLGQSFLPVVNALLLGSLLYRSRLVPRIIPLVGTHRSAPSAGLRHRSPVRTLVTGVRGNSDRCTADRGVGVLARPLPGDQGLQTITHHDGVTAASRFAETAGRTSKGRPSPRHSILRPALAGGPWVGQIKHLRCGNRGWCLDETSAVELDCCRSQERVIGQRVEWIWVSPQGDLGLVEVVGHELIDQQHAGDVLMLPVAGNAEVAIWLPYRPRNHVALARSSQLDCLLTVEGVGAVPSVRIEDVGADGNHKWST
jgi:hypothetical protein